MDVDDYAYAFFQNCHHLREWVDKASDIPSQTIDSLFESNIALRLCRDICNGIKHLTISRPSVDSKFSFFHEYDPSHQPRRRHFVLIADQKRDVLELAAECVDAWDQFLRPFGLPKQLLPMLKTSDRKGKTPS